VNEQSSGSTEMSPKTEVAENVAVPAVSETIAAVTDGTTVGATTDRQVKVSDVLAYAKKKCKSCNGTGMLTLVARVKSTERTYRVCGCAQSRFYAANAHRLEYNQTTGEHRWAEGVVG
jgi:hypothetical protein